MRRWMAAGGPTTLPIQQGRTWTRTSRDGRRTGSRRRSRPTGARCGCCADARAAARRRRCGGPSKRARASTSYVTWSARLQRSAEERLAAFAPSTTPGPRDGLPDADRRNHRRGRAPDTAGRKPEETRPCDRAGRRPRTPPVERPRGRRVRRSARAAARQRRRRRGRQRRRREAGGAAPGCVPPAAGATSRGSAPLRRRRSCGCGRRCPRAPAWRYSPSWRPPRPPRGCSPTRACRRGWSSTVSSSTRRRT